MSEIHWLTSGQCAMLRTEDRQFKSAVAIGRTAETLTKGSRLLPPTWTREIVQDIPPEGLVDLGDGFLAPELLAVDLLAGAYAEALAQYGPAALTYGANEGAMPLRAALADRASAAGGTPCCATNVLVTAGTSHGLHLVATTLARFGDVVLCESTSYHLARRIFTDLGLRPVPIPTDAKGPDPDALLDLARAHRAAGDRVAFAYLIPTFHNPTGRLIGAGRRKEIVAAAQEADLPIVEDDAYAELILDDVVVPPSLAALASYQGVIRLCSFSKTLGHGLRLGWLLADTTFVGRLAAGGLLSSGGALNHLASLAVAPLITSGAYDERLRQVRGGLKARRDALVSGLTEGGSASDAFDVPHGGFFLWLRNADGERAESAGIRVADGTRFGRPAEPSVRLSYSFNTPETLAAAGRQLASRLQGD